MPDFGSRFGSDLLPPIAIEKHHLIAQRHAFQVDEYVHVVASILATKIGFWVDGVLGAQREMKAVHALVAAHVGDPARGREGLVEPEPPFA